MAEGMRSYLGSTRFTEYEDLRPPIVKVSADGTLGWVMVQLRARGVHTDEGGAEKPLEFVCAWISLVREARRKVGEHGRRLHVQAVKAPPKRTPGVLRRLRAGTPGVNELEGTGRLGP